MGTKPVFDFGQLVQWSFHVNVLSKQGKICLIGHGNISIKEKGSQSQQHVYSSETFSDGRTQAHKFTNSKGVRWNNEFKKL